MQASNITLKRTLQIILIYAAIHNVLLPVENPALQPQLSTIPQAVLDTMPNILALAQAEAQAILKTATAESLKEHWCALEKDSANLKALNQAAQKAIGLALLKRRLALELATQQFEASSGQKIARPWPSSRKWIIVGCIVLALATVGAMYWYMSRPAPKSAQQPVASTVEPVRQGQGAGAGEIKGSAPMAIEDNDVKNDERREVLNNLDQPAQRVLAQQPVPVLAPEQSVQPAVQPVVQPVRQGWGLWIYEKCVEKPVGWALSFLLPVPDSD